MGANNDIVFRVRAEDAGMVRTLLGGAEALRAGGKAADSSKAKIKDLGDEGGRAGEKIKRGMGDAGQTINITLGNASQQMAKLLAQYAGFGSVMAGMYTSVRLFTAEYERFKQQRGEARTDFSSYSKAMAQAELSADSPESFAKVAGKVPGVLQKAGVPREQWAAAVGALEQTLSARGMTKGAPDSPSRMITEEEAFAVWQEGVNMMAATGNMESVAQLAPGAMDIYRANPKQSVKEIFGRMRLSFGDSRVTTMAKMGEHVVPVTGQLMNEYGMSPAEATALVSVSGFEMNEGQGRVQRTAALRLSQEIDEKFGGFDLAREQDRARFKQLSAWEKIQWTAGELPGMSDTEKKLAQKYNAYLQGLDAEDPEIRKIAARYKGTHGFTGEGALKGETRAEPLMRSFVDPGDRLGMRTKMRASIDRYESASPEEAIRKYGESTRVNPNSQFQQFRRAEMAVEGVDSALRLGHTDRAWQGLAMRAAEVLSDQDGTTALGKRIREIVNAAKAGSYSDGGAIDLIQQEIQRSEDNLLKRGINPRLDQWGANLEQRRLGKEESDKQRYERLSPAQRNQVDTIRKAREALGEIHDSIQKPSSASAEQEPVAQPAVTDQSGAAMRALTDELAATRGEIANLAVAAGRVQGAQVSVTVDDGGAQAARRLLDRPLPIGSLMG